VRQRRDTGSAAARLGAIGLPEPIVQLRRRRWDAIVVGGGHNGLACAAYLARAKQNVLVLEARERIGGACTLEETWPGFRVSPCAYLAGLLHPLVIEELGMEARGFQWMHAEAGLFVPFEDGSSIQLWDDAERCEAEIRSFAPLDLDGFRALRALKERVRDAIRPPGSRDLWIGRAPKRPEIEERLAGDEEGRRLLFQWSMVELVERYLRDERLQMALLGQGVIGTNASPHAPGAASIHFHHQSGRMYGKAGAWGFVRGGMGMVSFILCDIARELGATVATGVRVLRILPEEGVELEAGECIPAPIVVSNADPRTTLSLLGDAADPAWRARVERIPMRGCTVKLSVALRELPDFTARPGVLDQPHHRGQINTPLTKAEWSRSYEAARRGELPERLWTELYFPSACDDSLAPDGMHLMSVFAQYVPFEFASGSWDSRREEVGDLVLSSIGRYCHDLAAAVVDREILGPPDIERRVGLWGGHIFQGECLPEYMWSERLEPRTPMPGVFLCGACTHPGGSVIALNGRNAATEILGSSRPEPERMV